MYDKRSTSNRVTFTDLKPCKNAKKLINTLVIKTTIPTSGIEKSNETLNASLKTTQNTTKKHAISNVFTERFELEVIVDIFQKPC